jgi:DNA-binding Lrp family transcriptional regulator
MKYTITINQHAVFVNGLINKTDAIDWAIIDYLKDFALYKKARKIVYLNEEYIWINYNHLLASLPIVQFKSKPALSYRLTKLRKLGLIKTCRTKNNSLYYTMTDKLIDVCFARQSDLKRLQESGNTDNPILTPPVKAILTPPVKPILTAQYNTKNIIINKDNNKESSFKNSSLKQTTNRNKPNNTNVRGFTSMSGNIWKVLEDIRQRGIKSQSSVRKTEVFCD